MKKPIEFDSLIGKTFKFYGAAEYQFRLDKLTWVALEDENDGYRSLLKCVELAETPLLTTLFFKRPVARVKLTRDAEQYYVLTDVKDKHVWLKIGTNYSDDYYPCFIFQYEPKPPKASVKSK